VSPPGRRRRSRATNRVVRGGVGATMPASWTGGWLCPVAQMQSRRKRPDAALPRAELIQSPRWGRKAARNLILPQYRMAVGATARPTRKGHIRPFISRFLGPLSAIRSPVGTANSQRDSGPDAPGGHDLVLIDKPANAIAQQRERPIPVITAAELKEHSEIPSVRARLDRVKAMVEARRKGRGESASAAS